MTELQFKKELSLRTLKGGYLLYGEEGEMISAYKRKLVGLLEKQGAQLERYDYKSLNLDILCENFMMMPMFGGMRAFLVEHLEATLSDKDCETFCDLFAQSDASTVLVVTVAGEFDAKKAAKPKKLVAAAEKAGVSVCFDRKGALELRDAVRAYCQRHACDLTPQHATALVERCGEDLGVLKNECEKLCAYVGDGKDITMQAILTVTSPSPEGDLYAISKLMLKGEPAPVLKEIDGLLQLRQPVALMLSNLGGYFSELYAASAARTAGVDATQAAAALKVRFAWRMQTAYRDSARLDSHRVLAVCQILCRAETTLKSSMVNDRVLLETTILRCMAALRGERL